MLAGFPLFPEQASTMAGKVDALLFFMLAVSGFFTLLIATALVLFAVRYRRRSDDERPAPIEGSHALEALWTLVPLGLTVIMFVWGASLFFTMARPPKDAIEIAVVGKQWMWKFQHMTGQREINQLHVPVGQPVKLLMTSEDVIHSFYVPAFRMKRDTVPGRYITAWFEATRVGTYHLFCAEYCGTRHSGMIGSIVVMEPARYQAWLAGATGGGNLVSAGERLFQDLSCVTCHRPDAQGRGPVLEGVFGRPVKLMTGEVVTADESYLRESILAPQAKLVVGYAATVMPTYQGLVSEEAMLQLVAYLKSIQGAAPAGGEMPSGEAVPAGANPGAAPLPREERKP